MRIVGKTNIGERREDEKVLVEVSKEEVANILGYYGTYDGNFEQVLAKLIRTREFVNVSKIYVKHSKIKKFQGGSEVRKIRTTLEEMAKALKTIDTVFDKAPTCTEDEGKSTSTL